MCEVVEGVTLRLMLASTNRMYIAQPFLYVRFLSLLITSRLNQEESGRKTREQEGRSRVESSQTCFVLLGDTIRCLLSLYFNE